MLSILLTLLCISSTATLQYHLASKLPIPSLTQTTTSIKYLSSNYLCIKKEQTNPYKSSLTILNNTNYSQIVTQIDTTTNQIKIMKDKTILTNYGNQLNVDYIADKEKYIGVNYVYGVPFVSEQVWVASKKLLCPTLAKIDIVNSQVKQYVYQNEKNCSFDYTGIVKQIGNDQLAYAARYNLYILDKQTLAVKQKIVEGKPFQGTDFEYMDIYTDSTNSQKTILVSCGRNHELFIYNKERDVFDQNPRFYNPTSNIKLTGPNQGVSFYRSKLFRWKNMRQSILYSNFNAEDQYLGGSSGQAVLKNKNMFVVTSTFSNKTIFYNFDLANFQYSPAFQIQIEQGGFIKKSGKVCSDEKYVFISTSSFLNFTGIVKIDVENRISKMLKNADNQTKANCSSFILINCEYLVTVCSVQIANYKQNAQRFYQIQLRNMTTLQIIDSYKLQQAMDIPIKLLRSQQYGEYFAVITKSDNDEYKDDCLTTMYKISDNKITKTEIVSTSLSFKNSRSSKNFIVSYKSQLNKSDQYLKLFKIENLQIEEKYEYSEIQYSSYSFSIYSENNYFIFQNNNDLYQNDVYDLSQPKGSRYLGSFYRQYYKQNLDDQGVTYFIIDGMLWIFNIASYGSQRPFSIVYNIQTPAVFQIKKMSQQNYQPKSYIYIPSKSQKNPQQCPVALYIVDKILYKFIDCQPYKDVEVYPIDTFDQIPFIKQPIMLFSSDRQHVILIYYITVSDYRMEIRRLDRLDIKVWSYKSRQQIYYADYNSRQQAVLQTQYKIQVIKSGGNVTASSYSLDRIDAFDQSQGKCIVFTGKDKNSDNYKLLYKRSLTSTQTLQATTPQKIVYISLDYSCKYVAIYLNNKMLQIYKIESAQLIKISQRQIEQVKSVGFTKYNTIVVQQVSNLLIFDIDLINFQSTKTKSQSVQNQAFLSIKYDVGYNGQLMAQSFNGRTLEIKNTSTQQNVGKINIQQPTVITGLSFLENGSLYIATNSSQLYLLDASPCPSMFINYDSICGCGTNASLIVDQCRCKNNFQIVNDRCQCPNQFQFSKSTYTCECGINSIQKGKQCKCMNLFKKVGTQCVCPESFSSPKKEVCQCNGIIDKNVCVQCDFPCEQCTAPGFNCISYQVGFYLIISGAGLIIIIAVILVIYLIRRKKRHEIARHSEQILVEETQITKSLKSQN